MNIQRSMYRLVNMLIIIPILTFSLLFSFLYNAKMKSVITDSLEAVANAQLAEMSAFCSQQKKNLNILGNLDVSRAALRGESDSEIPEYLKNLLISRVEATDYLMGAALLDSRYQIVACSAEDYAAYADPNFDSIVKRMGDNNFYVSNALKYSNGDQDIQSIIAVSKIRDGDDIIGYALFEISLDFYDNIRKQVELWNESTFYLLDGNHNIIIAGTNEDRRETFVTGDIERKDYQKKYNAINFKDQPQGSFSYQMNKSTYTTYYSSVDYTDWQVLLSVNVGSLISQKQISLFVVIFLILLCVISMILLNRFVSARIVRPINSMSNTLENILQSQNYALRVPINHQDELGKISGRINSLLLLIETENYAKAKKERILQEKAEKDALTKVLNAEKIRQYLRNAIERHNKDKTVMAVLFADVDDFKAFNTNYGHTVGDHILMFLASLLTRETGGTVGRVGGDEFLAVIEDPEKLEILEACLERVNNLAHSLFVLEGNGKHIAVSCSMGAVIVNFQALCRECITSELLIEQADAAMYEAKKSRGCRYWIQKLPLI